MQTLLYSTNYKTANTHTYGFVLGTQYGIMSIKMMALRYATNTIFSGFDPCCWVNDGELPAANDTRFWEHRYVDAIRKSAKKATDPLFEHTYGSVEDAIKSIITGLGLERVEAEFPPQVDRHLLMLQGVIEPEASAPKSRQRAEAKEVVRQALKHSLAERNEAALVADDGWGIF